MIHGYWRDITEAAGRTLPQANSAPSMGWRYLHAANHECVLRGRSQVHANDVWSRVQQPWELSHTVMIPHLM